MIWLNTTNHVDWLSLRITRALGSLTPRSWRGQQNHFSSIVDMERAWYFAFVQDRDTVLCFLLIQETKLGARKMQAPVVETRSSRSPAQSISTYHSRGYSWCIEGFSWKRCDECLWVIAWTCKHGSLSRQCQDEIESHIGEHQRVVERPCGFP